jgi:hypothetical protein
LEGAGTTVATEAVAGRRPGAVAVMLATPDSALVVTEARIEVDPAGMATRLSTEATSDMSEVSWTIVSEVEFAGVPEAVCNATSSTL